MRIKLLTFRYSATLGGFDDTTLVDFTRHAAACAKVTESSRLADGAVTAPRST
jgi:hypothetical protein